MAEVSKIVRKEKKGIKMRIDLIISFLLGVAVTLVCSALDGKNQI